MKTSTVETMVWVLLYGGLLAVGLGLAMPHAANTLGWVLIVVGALVALLGVVLIWVRSRMKAEGSR